MNVHSNGTGVKLGLTPAARGHYTPNVKLRVIVFAVLVFGGASAAAGAQALEGRTAPAQLETVRAAVLDGRLPPYDTWPQPAQPEAGETGTTGASTVEVTLGGAARVGGDAFWDQYLFRPGDQNALVRWTVHAEERGHWGLLLHADYYDSTPGWHPSTLILPSSFGAFPLEAHFLTRSWLWYDFHPLQLEIGRDQVHWGPLDHSLLVSDAVPFLDMVRGSIGGGPWSLQWILATPETRTSGGGVNLSDFQLVNFHRLEYRADTWAWAASERYIVHRPAGPFVLADVFPLSVMHQLDFVPNNNSLNFDGEWVPAPGYRLMGQLAFDDIDATSVGWPDNPVPTIWAFILGGEWQGTVKGDPLRLYAELGMTHYLWGNFDDPQARALYLLLLDRRTETMPLSSPYGPGAAWVNLSARWFSGPFSVSAALEVFDIKEGVDANTSYQYHWDLEGLGSQPDERLSLRARWQLDRVWGLTFEPTQTYHKGAIGLEARATVDWTP